MRMTPISVPLRLTMGAETDMIRSPVTGAVPDHEDCFLSSMAPVTSGVLG